MPTTLTIATTTYDVTLWKIVGAKTLYLTSATRSILFEGNTYLPGAARLSEQQLVENLEQSNLEIILPLDVGGFIERDLRSGLWNQARVEIVQYDYNAAAVLRRWKGLLFSSETDNGQLKVEVLDLSVLFEQPIGDNYQESCRTDHGSAACGRVPATIDGAVSSSVSRKEFLFYFGITEVPDLNFGLCYFEDGGNEGITKEIKTAAAEGDYMRVVLVEAVPYDITPGTIVFLKEGCDKKFSTCQARNNAGRFRGEPNIPGIYKILTYPKSS